MSASGPSGPLVCINQLGILATAGSDMCIYLRLLATAASDAVYLFKATGHSSIRCSTFI